MKASKKTLRNIALTIIGAGVLYRVLPHVPNFTPVTAIALFSGAYLSNRFLQILLPLVILFASDLFLNNTILRAFYPDVDGIVWFSQYMLYVYGAFILISFIGSNFLSKNDSNPRIAGSLLSSTIVFFLITNFGSWIGAASIYPQNLGGLMACYAAGLEFIRPTLLGDLVFGVSFFGLYKLAKVYFAKSMVTA